MAEDSSLRHIFPRVVACPEVFSGSKFTYASDSELIEAWAPRAPIVRSFISQRDSATAWIRVESAPDELQPNGQAVRGKPHGTKLPDGR